MVTGVYVSVAVASGLIGTVVGIVLAALATVRRSLRLNDREAAIALREIREATRPIVAVGTSIVKPRPEARGPLADESPAEPVKIYHLPGAERLAAGYAAITARVAVWRAESSTTQEYHGLVNEARRLRDRTLDTPASATIRRLAAERAAMNDEQTARMLAAIEEARVTT